MIDLLRKIPTKKSEPHSQDKKFQLLLADIGGAWYTRKSIQKIPQLRKQKISKKAQYNYCKVKRNLQTNHWNWNDWKLQINWNMLEWVNQISKFVEKKPIQILQINSVFIKIIERLIGLAIQN